MTTPQPHRGVLGRMLLGVALVAGLGVLAVAFQSTDPVRPEPGAQAPGAVAPSPTAPLPTTSPPPTTPPLTPSGSPAAVPGIQLIAMPRSDGAFDVVETITVRTATDRLMLSPPFAVPTDTALTAFKASSPRAEGLVVRADGNPVPLQPPVVGTRRVIAFITPVHRIQLTYRLTGAIIRSTPSKPGRALGLIAPLAREFDGSLPTNLTVGRARNLFCPLLEDPVEKLCAGEHRQGMAAQPVLTAAVATVLVQLDLPLPPKRT